VEVVCRLLKYWDINQAVIWRIIYVNILKKTQFIRSIDSKLC